MALKPDLKNNMDILQFEGLQIGKLKKQFEKTVGYLQASDFKSADVKKMPNAGYYRAKLDDTNRLLFKIGAFQGKKYLFLLEIIHNHDYAASKFLNGAAIDETKLTALANEAALALNDAEPITYLNTRQKSFHILDKILSFDDTQAEVLTLPTPLIVIGSAGSGKTALTLEKLKTLHGRVLYTTLSAYLVENARNLYYSFGYENSHQEADFLSFAEYLETIEVPKGQEIDFKTFDQWIWRYKQAYKIKDSYRVFEEFKGVLTGSVIDKPYLSKEEYLSLGIKQSIFTVSEREQLYDLFLKYVAFLDEKTYFDSNLVAYQYLERIVPTYDFVVVDEVQDITNVQLYAILKSLNRAAQFVLCGDSNQIVHPNFFSWAQVKTLFYKENLANNIVRILATNYRNTPEVTHIANQLLRIKNARFGSIDKESTYLVEANSQHKGEVVFYENNQKINQELNQKTRKSAKFAVLVMRNEDKDQAKRIFQTPLLFSVQEAKGLEYENVILFNIISGYEKEFRELTVGIGSEDLQGDIKYGRGRDKSDKSLDEFKFYVNSLYVAITRAVKNLYVVETNKKHDLLTLLNLTHFSQQVAIKEQSSNLDEWQREARKLELQGKKEQAEAIRQQVLHIQNVPWTVLNRPNMANAIALATDPANFNKKAKDSLYEYALFYAETKYLDVLSTLKYRPADRWKQDGPGLLKRTYQEYCRDDVKLLQPKIQKYGIDFRNEFNLTPFMLAVSHGAVKIAAFLLENGAKTDLADNFGRNALQLAIWKSRTEAGQKAVFLNQFYPKLKNDSLKVKIQNRLVKIDNHQAEFLMLHFMIATLRTNLSQGLANANWRGISVGYGTANFVNFYAPLAPQIIAEFRRQRPYISSILAKNEVNRDDKYNKKLFVRIQQGVYFPNPVMEIQVENDWVNVYDLIDLEGLENQYPKYFIFRQIRAYRQMLEKSPNLTIDHDKFWQDLRTQ